jgi:predicted RNA-binding protein with PUA domain
MKIQEYNLRKLRWRHFLKQFGARFLTDAAGKWTLDISIPLRFIKNKIYDYNTIDVFSLSIHLMPSDDHKMWGYEVNWYDHNYYVFGFGPIALLCWATYPTLEKD